MDILKQLSTRVGDRTSRSNLEVAALCVAQPDLLAEIAGGLGNTDDALAADCAEVCTEVAKVKPESVSPYAKAMPPLLDRKTTRLRWEAMHTLALVAPLAPEVVSPLLPKLGELVRNDKSVIVRDYAVDAIGNFAGTSQNASKRAYPLLIEALDLWNGKHAGHALAGLANVAKRSPETRTELRGIGARYCEGGRGVILKAAKALLRVIDGL